MSKPRSPDRPKPTALLTLAEARAAARNLAERVCDLNEASDELRAMLRRLADEKAPVLQRTVNFGIQTALLSDLLAHSGNPTSDRSGAAGGRPIVFEDAAIDVEEVDSLVNPAKPADYFELRYRRSEEPLRYVRVALLTRRRVGEGKPFLVQLLPLRRYGARGREQMRRAVLEELRFYLREKGERKPWGYAVYHCGTAANLYSAVHWSYHRSRAAPPSKTSGHK